MAPTRTVKSKSFSKDGKVSKGSRKAGALDANTKRKVLKKSKAPPPKQQKTKSVTPTKKKTRVYTEKELGIPKLNMTTPVGVELPKGKKKGKVFVDDQESMLTILAIVNADKEVRISWRALSVCGQSLIFKAFAGAEIPPRSEDWFHDFDSCLEESTLTPSSM